MNHFITLFVLFCTYGTLSHAQSRDIASSMTRPLVSSSNPCTEKPEFLTRPRGEAIEGVESLPKAMLVARNANFYAESASSNRIKIAAQHIFIKEQGKTPEAKVLCGQAPIDVFQSFAQFAPTLIDNTEKHEVGNSMWQFQLSAQGGEIGVWNQYSKILSKEKSLEKLFKSIDGEYRFYEISPRSFEILIMKEIEGVNYYLSIVYDVIYHI